MCEQINCVGGVFVPDSVIESIVEIVREGLLDATEHLEELEDGYVQLSRIGAHLMTVDKWLNRAKLEQQIQRFQAERRRLQTEGRQLQSEIASYNMGCIPQGEDALDLPFIDDSRPF